MVLNARLNTFLEDNKIINRAQTGFIRKARTSDYMFVLKSLINKYINSKGGKLYSCFVDFHKASDTVIHPGLKVKLRELNINGKFYDILCSLYAKCNVCIRLGEHRTDFLESKVGVRQGGMYLAQIFINNLPDYLTDSPDTVYINNLP